MYANERERETSGFIGITANSIVSLFTSSFLMTVSGWREGREVDGGRGKTAVMPSHLLFLKLVLNFIALGVLYLRDSRLVFESFKSSYCSRRLADWMNE